MGAATDVGTAAHDARVPWGDVVMSAVAAVSWALIGMAGTAALGLRLLGADAAGSLGPMTAAVVALGAGGSVTPSGDVSAFGLSGAEADTAIHIAPLGVSLVGALLLSFFFLRSLRAAGVVVSAAELLARAGAVVALFVAMTGGLVWAGHDVVTIDGGSLGLDDLPGGGGGGVEIPGLGDVGDVGGLLPDRIGDLVDAEAAVGFTVDTVPTLLGGLGWSAGVLLVALLASRRTPLPRCWDAVHRVVRPTVSALVTVGLVAVAAGLAAAGYAAIGDDHPRRIAGAALLGAPNGVWLGIPIGLFVPWDGRASGALLGVLPHPVDDLLGAGSDRTVTLARLAELDRRVWLLGVAAALMMLLAGVLTGVRTPVVEVAARDRGALGEVAARHPGAGGDVAPRHSGAVGFAGRCALRLGAATALALPLLGWLTEVSVNASLSVLGFDAFGAGIELRGRPGMAFLLGAVWGAGAGAAGALLAWASGAAGMRAAPLARGDMRPAGSDGSEGSERLEGSYGSDAWRRVDSSGAGEHGAESGPYTPGVPYRPPNPDTNPYLRVGWEASGAQEGREPRGPRGPQDSRTPQDSLGPQDSRTPQDSLGPQDSRGPEDAPRAPGGPTGTGRPTGAGSATGASGPASASDPASAGSPTSAGGPAGAGGPGAPGEEDDGHGDVYGAPTVARPIGPPPGRGSRRGPGPRGGKRSSWWPDEVPPPPPPPPPAPRKPDSDR
ncbi:streptophobe family protein [Streptomyces griseoloalbus]|uniref:streptophobe family protein n=1 Tax=Streptomyces griseoloalbus TaxID=67303 RepID=UPI0033B512D4